MKNNTQKLNRTINIGETKINNIKAIANRTNYTIEEVIENLLCLGLAYYNSVISPQ